MSVSRNGVYKIYDHMHVAFPRIIPRIMPPNHTRESYHESYPWFQQGRAKHTPKHTPETYLRNIPRIIPPDATRFARHGVFGKGHIYIYIYIPPWEKGKHRLKNAVVGGYGTVPPMEGVFLSSKSFQNLRFGDLRLRSETAKGLFETSSRERRAPWSMARWRVTGFREWLPSSHCGKQGGGLNCLRCLFVRSRTWRFHLVCWRIAMGSKRRHFSEIRGDQWCNEDPPIDLCCFLGVFWHQEFIPLPAIITCKGEDPRYHTSRWWPQLTKNMQETYEDMFSVGQWKDWWATSFSLIIFFCIFFSAKWSWKIKQMTICINPLAFSQPICRAASCRSAPLHPQTAVGPRSVQRSMSPCHVTWTEDFARFWEQYVPGGARSSTVSRPLIREAVVGKMKGWGPGMEDGGPANEIQGPKKTVVLLGMMKNYPVMWRLFHESWNKDPY